MSSDGKQLTTFFVVEVFASEFIACTVNKRRVNESNRGKKIWGLGKFMLVESFGEVEREEADPPLRTILCFRYE